MRKEKTKKAILALSFLMALITNWSCGEDDGKNESIFSKSFVTHYYFPDTLEIIYQEKKFDTIAVSLSLDGTDWAISPSYHLDGCEGKERIFDSLMIRYADTTYNKDIYVGGNKALANPIDSITIISDADYDENHIAGSNLSDVVVFEGHVFGYFVLHGYPNDYRYKEYYDDRSYYIKRLLSKFRPEDYYLWEAKPFLLKFPMPSLSKTHHITFTFVTGGKTFKGTEELDFSK